MKGYYLMPHPPIMVPLVGKGEEKMIQSTLRACQEIGNRIDKLGVETIVIISPHGLVFSDALAVITERSVSGNLGNFGAKEVSLDINIDVRLAEEIMKNAESSGIATVALERGSAKRYGESASLDHGAIVPLYFVKGEKYNLVHIAYGLLSPLELYRFGMVIEQSVHKLGRNAVLLASGDLSHRLKEGGPYSYSPYGAEFDEKLMEILKEGDMKTLIGLTGKLVSEAGECGLRSLFILAGAMDGKKVKGEVLSYEGPFGVGYGVVDFNFEPGRSIYADMENINEERHQRKMKTGNPYTRLARMSLDYFFTTHRPMKAEYNQWQELFAKKSGVFVSIKKSGNLRGCIGTTAPTTDSVAQEIIQNAISAATKDPRFMPMNRDELLVSDLSVDVLGDSEPATKDELDPLRYGVIVSHGFKRGLLLPKLDGIDTVEKQLQIALQKAGISAAEEYDVERFEVTRYEEE
ncbi:MAG: AmmeMemoRadiSam system protein A [Proteocatella sp.]